MKNVLSIIAVVSFVLYLFAPSVYSWSYCAICAFVFITSAIVGVLPTLKQEPLNFGLFFSLTLFACTYVFPLYIYPFDTTYSLFQFGYDPNVITKCTALATLAHSMYWLGVSNAANKHYTHFLVDNIIIGDGIVSFLSKFVLILFIGFIVVGGLDYYTDRYLDGNMSANATFVYLNVLFSTIAVTLACMLLYVNKTSLYFRVCLLLGVIIVVILSTGSRTLPMYLLLPMAYVYQKRYHVSLLRMGLLGSVLLVAFIAIGQLRHEIITIDSISSYSLSSSNFGYWDNLTDFIVCNRNLYDIYSSVDTNGILWGKNYLGSILSTIPFSQGIVSTLFKIPTHELDSAYFCTYHVFGAKAPLGLGTHIVGDVYLASGLLGVVILFYFLGSFITKLKNGAIATGNNFMYIAYLYMLSYSIFFCRGSFFGAVKGIIWSAVVIYLYNKFNKR